MRRQLEPRALLSGMPAYAPEPTSRHTGTTLALDGSNPEPDGYPAGTIAPDAPETSTGQYSMITHQYDSASGVTAGTFMGESTPSYVLVHDPPSPTTLNDIMINDLQPNTFRMDQDPSGLAPEFGSTSTGALAYNLASTTTGQPVTGTVSWSGNISLAYSLPSTTLTGMSRPAFTSNGISVTWFGNDFTDPYATTAGTVTYTTHGFSPGPSISINEDLVDGSAKQAIGRDSQGAAQWFLPSDTGGSLNGLFTTPDTTSSRRS